jgi:hypothetical protein
LVTTAVDTVCDERINNFFRVHESATIVVDQMPVWALNLRPGEKLSEFSTHRSENRVCRTGVGDATMRHPSWAENLSATATPSKRDLHIHRESAR